MRFRLSTLITILLSATRLVADDDLRVLPDVLYSYKVAPEKYVEVKPSDMMRYWLARKADLAMRASDKEFEHVLNTPAAIPAYQKKMQDFFIEQLGGLPEKTPLNAKIVGELPGDGYRIEKAIFESMPKLYVTALMYVPLTKGPHPGVIVPCGHAGNGKAHDTYQRVCILFAKNGIAALCYDPIHQGERREGKEIGGGGYGHSRLAVTSMLVGRAAARVWVWDGIRAIDYLQSRSDILKDQIGCTGNSGGGTATSYIMAVDPRVKCAAPSCFISSARSKVLRDVSADGEQHIHNQIAFGFGDPELINLRAPKPTLICATTRDEYFDVNGTWDTFRRSKEIYGALGFSERLDLAEARDEHGFQPPLRVAAVRWMRRWLMQKDDAIVDDQPEHPILSDKDAQCTPDGNVMNLPGARRSFDFNIDLEKELGVKRQQVWAVADKTGALAEVRSITQIRPLAEIPRLTMKAQGTILRDGYRIEKLVLRDGSTEMWLPALAFVPATPSGDATLYLHEGGKNVDAAPGGPMEALVKQGHIVLAVDLPNIGETEYADLKAWADTWTAMFGSGNRHMLLASTLNTSFLAIRAECVMACGAFLENYLKKNNHVHLLSVGRAGPPCLHAAALEPQLFTSVALRRSLVSWSDVVAHPEANNQMVNAVHGVLKHYDLPDLLATLPKDKVKVIEPLDAMGQPAAIGQQARVEGTIEPVFPN